MKLFTYACALSLLPFPVWTQTTVINWSVFDMGFAEPASATTELRSVAGQVFVGPSQIANSRIESGFLSGIYGPPAITGIFTVTTTSDTGAGSLRWAMQTANVTAGLTLITFNIPGSGVHTITPSSPLPDITNPVIIDGYTQPGASPNTNGPGLGSNAVLLIEFNGVNTSGAFNEGCLNIRVGGCTIRGLVINRARSAGISLYLGGNNIVEGDFIGTDPTGTTASANVYGITIESEGNDRIGGTTPAARNIISGNTSDGIAFGAGSVGGSGHVVEGNLIGTNGAGSGALANDKGVHLAYSVTNVLICGTMPGARNVISGNSFGVFIGNGLGDPQVSHNLVKGNLIGTDVTGTAGLGNTQHGVSIAGLNNTVGGITSDERNVISGNGGYGVYIFGADSSVVQGNYIGTDVNGSSPIGNHDGGLYLAGIDLTIGGTTAGAANTIAFNGTLPNVHTGVAVIGSISRAAILGNSLYSNVGLGIDLGGDGVTPNDSCDVDTLVANNYQNYPVLTSALPGGGSLIVQGTLNSRPNSLLRIEFFASPTSDSTGYGEGKAFLGFVFALTSNSCQASFVDTLPVLVPLGYSISATATDARGNTSEFSRSISVGTTSVQGTGNELPKTFELSQNYPNPFNPSTSIRYALPTATHVTLKIYNILGQEVATLIDAVEGAGYRSIVWQPEGTASGAYFYQLRAGNFIQTRKLLLLR